MSNNVKSAREKPAPLVWVVRPQVIGPPCLRATIGDHDAIVWEAGDQFSHRSRVDGGRMVAHSSEDSAKASAEKRLRKVAT
jgi:hypothetical protein